MKAVATLLVLVLGAAIVLWYGNTLNSWVAGGLIGGFGALLLSIPISLVFFSYFSHHYDEHQQEELVEHGEISFAQRGSYSIVQDQPAYNKEYLDYEDQELYSGYSEEEIYEGELEVDKGRYFLPEQSVWGKQQPRCLPSPRYLPSPSSVHFPPVNQDPPPQVQRDNCAADVEQLSVRRRKSGSRQVKSGGSPGCRTDPSHSRYRSQALHAARIEAALRTQYDDGSVFPSTRTMDQEQMQHSSQAYAPQNTGWRSHSSHYLTQSSADDYSEEPGRIVDALPPQESSCPSLSASHDASCTNRFARDRDTQTEYGVDEPVIENLPRPLIRRAPYMYEDDPLRQEMAQYTQRPIVRRSSHYLKSPSADDKQ